ASLPRDRDSFKPPVPVAPPLRRLSVRNPLRSLRPPASKLRTRRATPFLLCIGIDPRPVVRASPGPETRLS
ncbi:hypothetical protein HN51_036433, partial [Arachis hypogaea]